MNEQQKIYERISKYSSLILCIEIASTHALSMGVAPVHVAPLKLLERMAL